MATEIRRLIFTNSEALEAIITYAAKNGITFPTGKIIRSKFAGRAEYEFTSLKQIKSDVPATYNIKDDQRAIILTVFSEQTLEQKYFNLTSNFIAVALVEYCIKHKIMLPKDAEKSLDLTDFNICLDISRDSFTNGDQSTTRLSLEE